MSASTKEIMPLTSLLSVKQNPQTFSNLEIQKALPPKQEPIMLQRNIMDKSRKMYSKRPTSGMELKRRNFDAWGYKQGVPLVNH